MLNHVRDKQGLPHEDTDRWAYEQRCASLRWRASVSGEHGSLQSTIRAVIDSNVLLPSIQRQPYDDSLYRRQEVPAARESFYTYASKET